MVLATGGYANVYGKSTNAMNSNATAAFRAHRRGALLRLAVFHPVPSDDPADQLTVAVQADADERVPAQRRTHLGAQEEG